MKERNTDCHRFRSITIINDKGLRGVKIGVVCNKTNGGCGLSQCHCDGKRMHAMGVARVLRNCNGDTSHRYHPTGVNRYAPLPCGSDEYPQQDFR